VNAFSVEAGSRWNAMALQRRLSGYSPWMIELRHGEWFVRGDLRGHSLAELQSHVDTWVRERHLGPATIEMLDDAPQGPPL
jgi:hypothetical protein